jgi:hypothetical protein
MIYFTARDYVFTRGRTTPEAAHYEFTSADACILHAILQRRLQSHAHAIGPADRTTHVCCPKGENFWRNPEGTAALTLGAWNLGADCVLPRDQATQTKQNRLVQSTVGVVVVVVVAVYSDEPRVCVDSTG